MLLFQPYHVFPILAGKLDSMDPLRIGCPIPKRETRRFWAKPRAKVGSIHMCRQNYYDHGFGKVKILDVYEQPLGEMDEGSARNEGGYTLPEYKYILETISKKPWNPLEEVFVVEMQCIEIHVSREDLEKYRAMYREHLRAVRSAMS